LLEQIDSAFARAVDFGTLSWHPPHLLPRRAALLPFYFPQPCGKDIHVLLHSAPRTQGIDVPARPRSYWLTCLFAALARAKSAVQAELRARHDVAELASMEDRMLRENCGFGARPWFAAVNPKTLAGGGTDCCGSARPR